MSFFSKKPDETFDDFIGSDAIVKTMQDDLDTINGIVHPKKTILPKPIPKTPSTTPGETNTQSPFLKQDVSAAPPASATPRTPEPVATKVQPLPSGANERTMPDASHAPTSQESGPVVSKLFISLTTLLILVAIGGIYYFIHTDAIPETPNQTPQEPSITEIPKETAPLFSEESPNYLPLDTMQATPESVQALLIKTAKDVQTLNTQKPVEFFLTDTSNNPLSFASFAKLSGMTLSPVVLATLGETFSLFIYTGQQNPHISLSIESKDTAATLQILKEKESFLEKDFTPLFLGDTATKPSEIFADSAYQSLPIRFININPETMLSVDYSVTDTNLIVSTSMQTHHMTIDRIR